MTERRRFSSRERAALYLAADGKCTNCGTELEPGWHADHVQAWSRDGQTDVINGQALCQACNLKKGNRVLYSDAFRARPFQREVINSVLDGMASGRDTTIVQASPGSGKTLAYQAAATYAYREGLADLVAVFVPRIVLAQQCETTWLHRQGGQHAWRQSSSCSMPQPTGEDQARSQPASAHRARRDRRRIRHHVFGARVGPIYESGPSTIAGRFLLIADEAQFCGDGRMSAAGARRAGALISDLHGYAAHTLLLTGTPYRSDGQPSSWRTTTSQTRRASSARFSTTRRPTTGLASPKATCDASRRLIHDARIRWKQVDNTTY